MITDFLVYERTLGASFLIPLLENHGIGLAGKSVLDVGCGYGGVLSVLQEKYGLLRALGIDLDPEMIRLGLMNGSKGVQLETGNFFEMNETKYDFIIMRDVLEHIVDVKKALTTANRLLNSGGMLYISFAPFYSPFGGHQHNGSGFFSNLPWLQLLPEAWFRKLLRLPGNSYKSSTGLESDMESVLDTRLTLAGFRQAQADLDFKVQHEVQYLIRPDYKIKFGLPQVRFPRLPILEEFFCTGTEAILVKD